jgi:hypothetical protein
MRGVQFQLALKIRLRKERNDGGEVVAQPIFYSRQQASLRATDIDTALTETTEKIQRGIEEYTREGSGWLLIGWWSLTLTSPDISHSAGVLY